MNRYFLHLRDGTDIALDDEGLEFADMESLQREVLASARDLISGDVKTTGQIDFRCRIDAEDGAGQIVYSLPFSQAVSIIPEDA